MRVAVDGAVEHDGQILLIEYNDARLGPHWGLPGGGVEPGESIQQALVREVLEETGAHVIVGRLLMVNEIDPARYGTLYSDEHELRLLFHCTLATNQEWHPPTIPDPAQVGIGWVALSELPQIRLLPPIGVRLYASLTEVQPDDRFNLIR